MIFASVGSMLPFDRFVQGVDEWAGENPTQEVLIQIGEGKYEPVHAKWVRIMPHAEYRAKLDECELFVAHVGIGSMLQGLEHHKQMLLMPRLASLKEHTTDHQLHTAERFKNVPSLLIVDDVSQLQAAITRLLADPLPTAGTIAPYAPASMISKVAEFLNTGYTPNKES